MGRDTVGIPGYAEPLWLATLREHSDRQHLKEASQQTLTLGQLTVLLAQAPLDAPVEFRGCQLDGRVPGRFISWRGVYADLALEPDLGRDEPVLARDLLAKCREADGETFEGYKGGDYTMDADTPVWVDSYGEYHHWGLVAVRPLVRGQEIASVLLIVRDWDAEAQS